MATTPTLAPEELRSRYDKASGDGRWQTALDLIKQLAKINPSAEHQELLRTATFERGRQLLRDGKSRDAIVVFKNALAMNGPPEFQAKIAAHLAEAGDVVTALSLSANAPATPQSAAILVKAVDASVILGKAGRGNLTPEHHAAFDAILAAFEAVEQGRDDDARQSLQSIPVSSPFLEWKLLIRGLSAYYGRDDARALDNWQRLSPERLPWRLAAPFRFAVDAVFREAQPPPTRERLQRLVDTSSGGDLLAALRSMQSNLGPWDSEKDVRRSLEQAAGIAAALKVVRPDLTDKFRRIVYESLIRYGNVGEVKLFQQRLGHLPIDPRGRRLIALIGATASHLPAEVEGWAEYVRDIPGLSSIFGDVQRAEAIVLERLAGAIALAKEQFGDIPPHIPKREDCYRRSIALVPDRLTPHEELVKLLSAEKSKAKAAYAAAKALVERFPTHVSTWLFLGERYAKDRKPTESLAAYRSAVKADPMNAESRRRLSEALWSQGMAAAGKKTKTPPKPESYRPLFDEAARTSDVNRLARYAIWAAVEFRLGHAAAAQEAIDRAMTLPQSPIALALALHLAASGEKKLPEEAKAQLDARWNELEKVKPAPADVIEALEMIAAFDSKAFRGKRELVKRFLPSTSNRSLEQFSEDQLLKLGRTLLKLKMRPQGRDVVTHGKARFRGNPWFPLSLIEILGTQASPWQLSTWIEDARKSAAKLPREQQERVLAQADELVERFHIVPGGERLFEFLGSFFDSQFGDDDN
jgi:tetratricopeptide (TPR) repeat protein